ncbi:MAG: hypothetical protein NT067_00580 [Candidatus Diapherotrites archaeon]|nr:hypothetical protein [Candidatus Diapherotrites archaeon]
MNAINRYTFLGLLLIILGASARADFVSGSFDLQAKCCDSVLTTYEFTNSSSETLEYTLTAIGDSADWANINGQQIDKEPLVFELKAGETKTLYAFFTPCCYAAPGTYVIGLKYSSTKGTKTQNVTLTLPECRTLTLEIEPENKTAGQCEPAVFDLKIANKSITTETVQAKIEGIPAEWVSITAPSEFLLEKESERAAQIKISAPCDAELKTYTGKATAKIKGTDFSVSSNFSLEIKDKQAISIGTEAQKKLQACNDREEQAALTIKNNGRAKDSLQLSLEGPGWIELKDKALVLEAGESKDVKVYFHTGSAEEKTYTFKIKAASATYAKETSQEFSVALKDCFNLGIAKTSGPESACIEDTLEYKFEAENTRQNKIKANASISGMKAAVSPESFELAPGKKQELAVKFELSGEKPGKKSFLLEIESENFKFSKEFSFTLSDCYSLAVSKEGLEKAVNMSAGAFVCPQGKVITSEVKNTGAMEQIVEVKATGIEWLKIEPTEIALNAGETKEFYTYLSPPLSIKAGDYEAQLEIKARDYSSKSKIAVKVKTIGIEQVDVSAESEIEQEILETEKTVKAKIKLRNTGNCTLSVSDIEGEGYTVKFDNQSFDLDINEEKTIIATVSLGKNTEDKNISMQITITTDKGIIRKNLLLDLAKDEAAVEEIAQEEAETSATPEATATPAAAQQAGLASLAGGRIANLAILFFLGIIALIIVVLTYQAYKKPEGKTEAKAASKKSRK